MDLERSIHEKKRSTSTMAAKAMGDGDLSPRCRYGVIIILPFLSLLFLQFTNYKFYYICTYICSISFIYIYANIYYLYLLVSYDNSKKFKIFYFVNLLSFTASVSRNARITLLVSYEICYPCMLAE